MQRESKKVYSQIVKVGSTEDKLWESKLFHTSNVVKLEEEINLKTKETINVKE